MTEEGVGALYRALPPRLVSVVPMMGIQLAVYEVCRRQLTIRRTQLNDVNYYAEEAEKLSDVDSELGFPSFSSTQSQSTPS